MDNASSKTSLGETRQKLIGIAAIAVILASAVWIYRWESAPSEVNLPLHQSIGNVLAEETFRQAGHGGKIVIVTMDTRRAPELKIQMDAFYKHLKALGGCTVADKIVLDPGENPKYRPGSGLSAKRFLKIARKHPGVDAIVSFVGAPELSDEEIKQMKSIPKFIAETHSPERLVSLFDKKLLLSAIVPRYDFPAPGPRQPQTIRQWFDHYFQIVHPDTILPANDELP